MIERTNNVGLLGALTALVSIAGHAIAQPGQYSLDDNPSMPISGPTVPPYLSAEDPYGFGLPALLAGAIGPSPSLAFGYTDADILLGPVGFLVPPHVINFGPYQHLDALSGIHTPLVDPRQSFLEVHFSVDRATTGFPGSGLFTQATNNQQPGDIYVSTASFLHPQVFVGTLTPPVGGPVPTFSGVLPTAGGGGSNILLIDESVFGLTAGNGVGVTVPPTTLCPAATPGSHDNLDAYNLVPPSLDIDGDRINDVTYFHSTPPVEGVLTGTQPGDIVRVLPGGASAVYSLSATLGLDSLGIGTDDIDGLVLWDGPDGPDFALFSLSPGSASVTALSGGVPAIDAATIFFTDFSGLFAVYAYGSDLGVDPAGPLSQNVYANVDALAVEVTSDPPPAP